MHSEISLKINKVIDHIEKHLCEEHQLEKLAKIACLSKFHFHRTFKITTQETPNEYIIRKRIEKIAALLIHNNDESISNLSFKYGFQNLSSFSRSFKKYYGFSASELKQKTKKQSRIETPKNSKIGKTSIMLKDYLSRVEKIKEWMTTKAEISVKKIAEVQLAYVRHWGSPYTIHEAFDKLLDWQNRNNVNQLYGDYFTLFHDNPSLTVDYKIQQSACAEITKLDVKEDEISVLRLPSQKYVIGKFELKDIEFEMAWNSMLVWINENNLKIKDGPRYERFLHNSLFDNSSTYQVEIGITVN